MWKTEELMTQRHSVRQYTDRPIEEEKRRTLNALIREINEKTGLHLLVHGQVKATSGKEFYTKLDLGIVKYHFEIANGHNVIIRSSAEKLRRGFFIWQMNFFTVEK